MNARRQCGWSAVRLVGSAVGRQRRLLCQRRPLHLPLLKDVQAWTAVFGLAPLCLQSEKCGADACVSKEGRR